MELIARNILRAVLDVHNIVTLNVLILACKCVVYGLLMAVVVDFI